jgi:hypothetical protein
MRRILLKLPTRSRPQKVIETLKKYVEFAEFPNQIGVALSCDLDDGTMKIPLNEYLSSFEWSRVFYGNNKTKIEACNANMNEIEYPWDIVVLISDDMVPQVRGYDSIIRNKCEIDGILWLNDGYQKDTLNTLTIMGRTMYSSFGYLYHPSYKSFYCDTEFTDLCRTTLKDKCVYYNQCIIRHDHPGNNKSKPSDFLYARNQGFWYNDMKNYIARKNYLYDWSILIPTITERSEKFNILMDTLHEKSARICPTLKIQFLSICDNRQMSIGIKRQKLLEMTEGRYSSFIDDDDEVTDAYFEDAMITILNKYEVMRLRGKTAQYTFTHSLMNTLSSPAAKDNEFLRPPNHLNVMLADVAKLIPFNDRKFAEDLDWTIRLSRTNYLQTEYSSDSDRIHYIYNIRGELNSESIEYQKKVSYLQMLEVLTPVKKTTSGLRLGSRGFVSV